MHTCVLFVCVCVCVFTGECLFLCIGVRLCYCIRSAPSFYFETKFISFAIFNELLISSIYYVVRYVATLCLSVCPSLSFSHSNKRRHCRTSPPASTEV